MVVGAGPAGAVGRPGPGPGRPVGRPGRARALPRVEERLRRGGLRPGARRHRPRLVGGGAGRAVGGAPLDHDDDRDPVAVRRLPLRRLGRRPLQRHDHPALPLRRLAGRQGDRGRSPAGDLHRGHRPGARPGRAGWSGSAPTATAAELRAPVVIACDGVNSFLAKEAGLLPRAEAVPPHPRGEGGPRPAAGRHQRALRRPGPRGRRHRDPRLHRDSPGRRLPLHQRRHGERRRRAVAPRAGRVRGPARGAHGRPQGPSGHRPAAAGLDPPRVRGPPHPRGRVRHHARRWPPTGCSWPGTPRR